MSMAYGEAIRAKVGLEELVPCIVSFLGQEEPSPPVLALNPNIIKEAQGLS